MPEALSRLTDEELLERLRNKATPPSPAETAELAKRGIIYDWFEIHPPQYGSEVP